jgi:hypothetical protein
LKDLIGCETAAQRIDQRPDLFGAVLGDQLGDREHAGRCHQHVGARDDAFVIGDCRGQLALDVDHQQRGISACWSQISHL